MHKPAVDHPRWSQKTERILGGERKTEIYNGYGPEVSALSDSNFSDLGDRLSR